MYSQASDCKFGDKLKKVRIVVKFDEFAQLIVAFETSQ